MSRLGGAREHPRKQQLESSIRDSLNPRKQQLELRDSLNPRKQQLEYPLNSTISSSHVNYPHFSLHSHVPNSHVNPLSLQSVKVPLLTHPTKHASDLDLFREDLNYSRISSPIPKRFSNSSISSHSDVSPNEIAQSIYNQSMTQCSVSTKCDSMYSDSESISSNITRLSKYSGPKLMFECPDLDNYRTNVKKIQDPKVHLNFAKQLIHVGKEMSKDSEMDKARLKKNQDILNKEALFWIKKAASDSKFFKLGDPDALFMLADCYGTGELGVAIDNQRAFELYKKAAKQSHYDSIYRVAVCYEVGAGVRPNQSKAFQMYRKAAVAKNTAAMYKMGLVLLDGLLGQAKNPREAINWIREAARQADESNPEPLHQLGLLFLGKDPELSKHLVPDPTFSYEQFLHAAELGYAPSQFEMANALELGKILPKDERKSIQWCTKAAQQGYPEAEFQLSLWYLTGIPGFLEKSPDKSFYYALEAAKKGFAKAEFSVGHLKEYGIGTRADFAESIQWYKRAAAQDNTRAKLRLKELLE